MRLDILRKYNLARNSRTPHDMHYVLLNFLQHLLVFFFCNTTSHRINYLEKFTWHSVGHLAVCCAHSLSLSLGNAKRSRGSFNRAMDRDVCASVFTSNWLVFRLLDKKLPRKPVKMKPQLHYNKLIWNTKQVICFSHFHNTFDQSI